MKKILIPAATLMLILGLILSGCSEKKEEAAQPETTTPKAQETPVAAQYSIKLGGGPTGGTFNTFANGMAVYVPKVQTNIQATAVGSGGSVENVKRVSSGESDFGLCYAVDSDLGFRGKLPKDTATYQGQRSMGYLYGAPAQLIVKADSGLSSAMDLKGKRVAVGNAGSGAAASAERFFRHVGIWDEFKPTFMGYSAAASAFKDGKIDAFWVLVGYPNSSVIEASVQVKIKLLDVGMDAEKSGFYDAFAYSATTIPAGTYGKEMPECKTFQDSTILTVNKDISDDLVYAIMKTLWSKEGMEAMVLAKSTFKEMNMENNFRGASVPLHPGAVKFWQEKGVEIPARLMP
jgi:TRAP transporter TAXI family solute receptor